MWIINTTLAIITYHIDYVNIPVITASKIEIGPRAILKHNSYRYSIMTAREHFVPKTRLPYVRYLSLIHI